MRVLTGAFCFLHCKCSLLTQGIHDMKLTVSQLKPARYNPRTITTRQLSGLSKSIATLGDLSGVVWNKRSGVLVSGHQRMKTTEGKKTRIVTQPYTDAFGTIALGYVEVQEQKGVNRIPLRIVDWSDKKVEMAANVAANAHGGEFDTAKLKSVLAALDSKDKVFDVELLGLDPLLLRTIKSASDAVQHAQGSSTRKDAHFPEYSETSFSHDVTCPKCGHSFNHE